MRKSTILTLLFCVLFFSSFAPKPVESEDAPLSEVERLYYTCKIWGFLKYYHPLVGKGSYDWNEKLLSVFNSTKNIQTYEEFSTFMTRWIYYMGDIGQCKSCDNRNRDNHFLKNFDLSWTQINRFSDELKASLKNIENNRFQGTHHYMGIGDLGQFEAKNDQLVSSFLWQEESQRLMLLFRYWNYIEYFFPYKYQTDQDWDDVLMEMIPKFKNIESKLELHLALLELVVKIDDTHAGFLTPSIEEMPYHNYLPARIEMIEDQAVVTEIIDTEKAIAADLKVGDAITRVNGQSVRALHESHKHLLWGSNEAVKERNLYHTLFMGMKTPPNVTIDRDGVTRNTILTLYRYSDLSYTKGGEKIKWNSPTDSIGYANVGELASRDVAEMMGEFMDKTVIILDLRNNARGTYRALANYLSPTDTTFALYAIPDYTYPGKFVWKGEARSGADNPDYYKGKVLMLVNEKTQDHGEFTCMSLLTAPNITVVGSQTAGTDGKATQFPMYARYYTAMTGMGVFFSDKSEAQRIGITPDIEVNPTIQGIREGRDEILEKAMEIAREEVARVMEEERVRLAMLALARDSLAMDSLAMDSLQIDSLQAPMMKLDSLQVDSASNNNRDY